MDPVPFHFRSVLLAVLNVLPTLSCGYHVSLSILFSPLTVIPLKS